MTGESDSLKKYEDMLDASLLDQLRVDGIKFIRWAYAGSNDEGGIVEIQLYDSDEVAVAEIDVYGCELDGRSRNSRVLKMGLAILEDSRGGFEINDGGYGWILLNTQSEDLWASEKHNMLGMESGRFDADDFDRVEFYYNEDWEISDEMIDAIDVKINFKRKDKPKNKRKSAPVPFTRDQKKTFMSVDKTPGQTLNQELFNFGGTIQTQVDGAGLRRLLIEIGINCSESFYFWSEDSYSKTEKDPLTRFNFKIDGEEGCRARVFIDGWSDQFLYKVMYESSVIECNPKLQELIKGDL